MSRRLGVYTMAHTDRYLTKARQNHSWKEFVSLTSGSTELVNSILGKENSTQTFPSTLTYEIALSTYLEGKHRQNSLWVVKRLAK